MDFDRIVTEGIKSIQQELQKRYFVNMISKKLKSEQFEIKKKQLEGDTKCISYDDFLTEINHGETNLTRGVPKIYTIDETNKRREYIKNTKILLSDKEIDEINFYFQICLERYGFCKEYIYTAEDLLAEVLFSYIKENRHNETNKHLEKIWKWFDYANYIKDREKKLREKVKAGEIIYSSKLKKKQKNNIDPVSEWKQKQRAID